jgi:hypothetical protein
LGVVLDTDMVLFVAGLGVVLEIDSIELWQT